MKKLSGFLKDIIRRKGMKYTFVAKAAGIEYQRLMRLFNQNAVISGSETGLFMQGPGGETGGADGPAGQRGRGRRLSPAFAQDRDGVSLGQRAGAVLPRWIFLQPGFLHRNGPAFYTSFHSSNPVVLRRVL